MNINQIISQEIQVEEWQVTKAVNLMDEGKTLPFVARYRKEATGSLTETHLRDISERLSYLNRLQERKTEVLKSIDNQGKLTEELKIKIEQAQKLQEVEDYYLPYKKKKKTRADIAIEKGLKPAADFLVSAKEKNDGFVSQFIDAEKEINSIEEVIKGSKDIIAQTISENVSVRNLLRSMIHRRGFFKSKKTNQEDQKGVYQDYYDYNEKISYVKHHHVLALNRGSRQKLLKLSIDFEESPLDDILSLLKFSSNKVYFKEILEAGKDSLNRLIMPTLFTEIFSDLLDKAEKRAVEVFAENFRNLLLQKPVAKKRILGIDPGFRTGCKIVYINEYGDILDHGVILPHPPVNKVKESQNMLLQGIKKHDVSLIVIGNGTASRETQQFIVDFIKNHDLEVKYAIVSEAGASVYSASKVSVEELPEYDVTTRGAVSIARRVQDPLAELVKIPPESIGVGMYQHDITASVLKKYLEREVESVVNHVGVNLNTASKYVLKYISGFNSKSAANIIDYRKSNGPFKARKQLLKVSGVGPKAYEQAAGFCRIPDSVDPFDNTTIHPENYDSARSLLGFLDCETADCKRKLASDKLNYKDIGEKTGSSEILAKDIVEALLAQGLDPRDEMPQIDFKDDILAIEDLKTGMILQGTVSNVVDFGAFIDIGIKNSGLLHKSNIADKFVQDPSEYLKVGEIIKVKIISIDLERERIGLSMKDV